MRPLAHNLVSGYDAELNQLTTTLADLGSIAEGMVSDAVKALSERDELLAQSVIERDKFCNSLQARIDQDAMRILALRGPMAADLRLTVGAMRIATDLERIGDLSEGVARRALTLTSLRTLDLLDGVTRVGMAVKAQLSEALDALLQEDSDAAVQVWMADRDVDEMYNLILSELLTHMSKDVDVIDDCAPLLFAAKNLERIGDHTSNICEVIYFTQTGKQLIEDKTVQFLVSAPDPS